MNVNPAQQPSVIVFAGAKGGVGTTVTAVLAARIAADRGRRTVLIDATGSTDAMAALGLQTPAGDDGTVHTNRVELTVVNTTRQELARRIEELTELRFECIVVDAGKLEDVGDLLPGRDITLVLRNCYLALRNAVRLPHCQQVVLVTEPGRPLGASDVADVLGAPVVVLPYDQGISRAVDAGLMLSSHHVSTRKLRNIL